MSRKHADSRLELLREQIARHDHLYYVLSEPEISDAEYDNLMLQLKLLEAQYPDLVTPDSPSQRVGGGMSSAFKSVVHDFPMLSLGNVFDESELNNWLDTLPPKAAYLSEWKLDGVSLSLTYVDGILGRAVTRGTGIEGEDVTHNAVHIQGIPKRLPKTLRNDVVTVRGEVIVYKSDFSDLNNRLEAQGQKTYKNERNFVSGSLRQKNANITAERKLRFIAYSYHSAMGREELYSELSAKAVEQGFTYVPSIDIWSVIKQPEQREPLPYVVDGIVVKVDSLKVQKQLGFRSREPRWAAAYKFPASAAVSTLEAVDWQVGRTGNITPVARITPVRLHGVTVSNVTLHNAAEIERLGVYIGANVVIERRGDVIPKIVSVVEGGKSYGLPPIGTPMQCPCCYGRINKRLLDKKKREAGANYYCTNPNCPDQVKGRLLHFVSREGVDIDGLGASTIGALVDLGLLKTWSDIFHLTVDDLLKVPGYAIHSASTDHAKIQAKANIGVSMAVLLESLGMPGAGRGTSKRLSEALGNLDRLLVAPPQTLEQINDIGTGTARRVHRWLKDNSAEFNQLRTVLRVTDDNRPTSQELAGKLTESALKKLVKRDNLTPVETQTNRTLWINWGWHETCDTAELKQGPLAGQTWVLTGTLEHYTREDATARLEALGAKVTSSVSKHTTIVIAGPGAGSKVTKAKELGINIGEESYLQSILE